MFYRNIIESLKNWKDNPNRKPLILRGARQVGKTSAVHLFSREFKQYLYFNLELKEDRKIFEDFTNVHDLIQALFLSKNKNPLEEDSLLFIDEIQSHPDAVSQLRYFKELYPKLYVIAAGSLLESVFNLDLSFPVGRVQYMAVKPLSFKEFLIVTGEEQALRYLEEVPVSGIAHQVLLNLFHIYTLIGGMPEIVKQYASHKNIAALPEVYDSILVPYIEDISKYASGLSQANVIRHLIQTAMQVAGQRITFQGFGNSNYKSREVGEALRILEKTFFLSLVYPITEITLPLMPNIRKSPRLQLLDTGLVTYFSNIQVSLLGIKDLNENYRGRITEHIVYQELSAIQESVLSKIHFWVKDKKTSSAEVDFVLPYRGLLIPVEVKSGATGTLRSLFLFMDQAEHTYAVRLYAGKVKIDTATTLQGKTFTLLNLPYYCAYKIEMYLDWVMKE